MSSSETLDTRKLLSEAAWLQSLARQLVRDPAAAEDAAQETLLAFSKKRAAEQPSRRWLASVLHNFLRQEHRSQQTRRRLESAASKEEATDSSAEVASRLEIQRRLIEAVQALDEPYRSTITLRFLESKPPREVARCMAVPVKAVHTRIERGLARLRSILDRSYRGRSEWLSVLAPLTLRHAAWALPGLGVLVMSSTVKWTGSLLGILVVGLFLQQVLSPEELPAPGPDERTSIAVVEEDEELGTAPEVSLPEVAGERIALPAPEEKEEPPVLLPTFEGRVTDATGKPVSGVTVAFELFDDHGQAPESTVEDSESDSDGVFVMERPKTRGRLVGQGNGYAPVVSPGINSNMPAEPPTVVVGPERSYSGFVKDADGLALADVDLAISLGSEVAEFLMPGGLSGVVPVARARSEKDGSFRFASVGFVEGSMLRGDLSGYQSNLIDLPSFSSDELELVLDKNRFEGQGVAGRVIDRHGMPVEGANVSAGQFTTTSDERGEFVLDLEGRIGATLRAVAKGWLPASIPLDDIAPEGRNAVVLTLGEAGRSISGRVFDVEGEPIAGAQVWTFDGEAFGYVPARFGQVEFMLSKDVEEMIAGGNRDGRETRTKADGSFELTDLADREYSLFAMHPETQCIGRVAAVDSGSVGIDILILDDEQTAPVAGRVLSYSGEPVEGAIIRVNRRFPDAKGGRGFRSASHNFHVSTDAEGRFRFEKLAISGTSLLLNGAMIASGQSIELDSVADLEEVEFLAPSQCHIRIHLDSDPSFANTFELLNAEGKKLHLTFMLGGVNMGAQAVGIENGVSPLTQTDESAATIVLYGDQGEEVHREAISLRAGKVNEIRL
ncbi:MAG: sigma-70 family RNA polymerase sigma factor [Planctomycetota bacterium]|jgi:RNA polymerase sigma-70 factor (ECF subfamily)